MALKYPDCVCPEDRISIKEGKWRRTKVTVVCPDCGQRRYVQQGAMNASLKKGTFTGRCYICRARVMGKLRGEESPCWKGGRRIDRQGYVLRTIQSDHPFFCMADIKNRIMEHRLVMAEHLGRLLLKDEHIHHIDGNRLNNHIENLVLMSKPNHQRFEALLQHRKIQREEVFNYV